MKVFLAVFALLLIVMPLVGCNTGAGNPSRSGVASPGVAPVYTDPAPVAQPAPSGGGAGSTCGGGSG